MRAGNWRVLMRDGAVLAISPRGSIQEQGKKHTAETITIPRAEYQQLVETVQGLDDIQTYDRVVAALDADREEFVPTTFADRLVAGEQPVQVYREWRGLSQAGLARRSGVNRIRLLDIEAGRARGSVETKHKFAEALG